MYIAHKKDNGDCQSIKEHSENVANLMYSFSVDMLKPFVKNIGLLHDIGKYQNSFQKRINGDCIKVEHSICGAKEAQKLYQKSLLAFVYAYCIAGHHTGLPDGGVHTKGDSDTTLLSRLNRKTEDYDSYKNSGEIVLGKISQEDFNSLFLNKPCDDFIEKYAFFTRYILSCLGDADIIDTRQFMLGEYDSRLTTNYKECLQNVNEIIAKFEPVTQLQKSRSNLQNQAYENSKDDADVYFLDMPTGSGKTICSVKIALEMAQKCNKTQIIYVIPFNSIIDQTYEIFSNIFADSGQILCHSSTFSYESIVDKDGESCGEIAKIASENWNADFIITTAVQFFESIYSNKKSKLRKVHNMANSIIVFDEAHMMPIQYLQPCLSAIGYLTTYFNSKAILLTATMPDYSKLFKDLTCVDIKQKDLILDKTLFSQFKRCNYVNMGNKSIENIVEKSLNYNSSLIVVNKRKTARECYSICRGEKYHLSTYMTAYDRIKTINKIKNRIKRLEKDYPLGNVPDERKITVVSTSLIEAGVDLDFSVVFREIAGVDNILQSGGRCNREGKEDNATTFVFQIDKIIDLKTSITDRMLKKYNDISDINCIKEYYDNLFSLKNKEILENKIDCTKKFYSIPFKTYGEDFNMIDSKAVSIVVERDETSHNLIQQLLHTGICNQRKLQLYTASVYEYELQGLLKQGVIDDNESGIYCLINNNYYDENIGLIFSGEDLII